MVVLWWCYSGSSGDSGGIGSIIKVKSGTLMTNTVQSSCSRQCSTVQYSTVQYSIQYSTAPVPPLPSPPLPYTLTIRGLQLPPYSVSRPWRALESPEGGRGGMDDGVIPGWPHRRPPTPDPRPPIPDDPFGIRYRSIEGHPYIHT